MEAAPGLHCHEATYVILHTRTREPEQLVINNSLGLAGRDCTPDGLSGPVCLATSFGYGPHHRGSC